MFAIPGLRGFAVSPDRSAESVSCNVQGVYVGHVPLLEKVAGSWRPRPAAEVNGELTACYRLPVDIAAKANALALIAHALTRADLALAAIVAVQMQIPNPPSLAKGPERRDAIARRARELARSGLLKVWDSEKHPRTGMPPNPGEFAPVDGSKQQDVRVAVKPGPNNPWTEFPDAEGGGGGGSPSRSGDPRPEEPAAGETAPAEAPKSWTRPDPKSKLQFMDETPPQLAPFTGGKTSGIFQAPNAAPIELQSGYAGPTADIPPESAGFDLITKSHVEGQAAALMRQGGISNATLYINNPKICGSCMRLLPRMLPPGATLDVVLPDKTVIRFKGVGP